MSKITYTPIEYLDTGNFFNYNKQFIKETESMIGDILQSKNIGPEGYIPIGKYRKNEIKFSSYSNPSVKKEVKVEPFYIHHPNFTETERIIASHLLFGKNFNYVLSGPMGSGKSTTCRHVFEYFKSCEWSKDSIFIWINFDFGIRDQKKIKKILYRFRQTLYNKIRAELFDILSKDSYLDDFLKHITKEKELYDDYFDFYLDNIIKGNPWKKAHTTTEKLSVLFDYIKNKYSDLEGRIELLMKFLKYLKTVIKKKNGKIIMVFDNIDRLPPIIQTEILTDILFYNELPEVRILLPLRRSTRLKLDNRASQPYAHIHFHGPNPIRILISRLEYYKNNLQNEELFEFGLKKRNIEIINNRIQSILDEIKNRDSNVALLFKLLSGKSVRLGMELSKRFFINYLFPYDESPNNPKSYSRTLLTYGNLENKHNPDDLYVANILSLGNTNQATLLNLRILQLINSAKLMPENRKACSLSKFLNKTFKYKYKQILISLNYLMSDKRALIGGDYFPAFTNKEDLFKRNDELRLTELGERYLGMSLGGTIYIQSCFASVLWSETYVPSSIQNDFYERFKVTRLCLKALMERETKRMTKFHARYRESERKSPFVVYSLTDQMINSLGRSFHNIVKSRDDERNYLKVEELKFWEDLCFQTHQKLATNKKLIDLAYNFRKLGE